MKKFAIGILVLGLLGIALIWGTIATKPEIAWRAAIVRDMAFGKIENVSWGELLSMLKPGSGFYLKELAETQNVYSAIRNPLDSNEHIETGADEFRVNCSSCHGVAAAGGVAPALKTGIYTHGASDWALYKNMTTGIEGTAMAAVTLDDTQAWQIVAYLRSLASQKSAAKDAFEDRAYPLVTGGRLQNSVSEPDNWLNYSGHYNGTRHSTLNQITRQNASSLQVKWIRQFDTDKTIVETTPLVNGDVMFVTEPPNIVHALDAHTGEPLWKHVHPTPSDVIVCCGLINRGVAIQGERVFFGTLDAKLIALNAKTGAVLWTTVVDDYHKGISITSAPLIVKDKLIIGVGGGEFGIRGYLDAYDINTGERLWRFYTIPAPGEPGSDSWAGDSWKTGGAPTWLTGAYDPDLNLLYWGIGNPGPLYQVEGRAGDNLYSDSVVALDVDTGELDWHFQFTPNDEHDWDANQIPVLVDRMWKGEERKLMLWANRNAFFYVLDRVTGEFLLGEAFAKQNWAEGLTDTGRPILIPEARVSVQGTLTWPSPVGATNWQSPTYSKETGLIYVPAVELGRIVFKQPDLIEYEEGQPFQGSSNQDPAGEPTFYTAVRAIDPLTGELVWESRRPDRAHWYKTGGLLSTSGGIVFGGDNTQLFVRDDTSGEILWDLDVGGRINASPMTHNVSGEQRLVLAAGRSIISVGLPKSMLQDSSVEESDDP